MNETNDRVKLDTKARAQTFLFQLKILDPSRIPIGMRLNRAIYALINATSMKRDENKLGTKLRPRNKVDKRRFVAGPTIDICAISRNPAEPAIIIAPGAIILKGEKTDTNVRTAPQSVNLNSAHSPLLWAAILCAISCMRKEIVSNNENKTSGVHPIWPRS